jgi:hypothetical protein
MAKSPILIIIGRFIDKLAKNIPAILIQLC